MGTAEDYHRAELRIALNPSHPAHILPPPPAPGEVILDIGCGAGQTLIAACADRVSYGVDIDDSALRLGTALTSQVRFVCARAERLPWRAESFDMVVSRVSLAYTDIAASLREIHRVLRPGGRFWMTLHPFSLVLDQAKGGNVKGWIFFCYIVVNSVLFHLAARQFRLRGRFESFQTDSGMRRALEKCGFGEIEISRGRHFVVSAIRR